MPIIFAEATSAMGHSHPSNATSSIAATPGHGSYRKHVAAEAKMKGLEPAMNATKTDDTPRIEKRPKSPPDYAKHPKPSPLTYKPQVTTIVESVRAKHTHKQLSSPRTLTGEASGAGARSVEERDPVPWATGFSCSSSDSVWLI